MSLSLYIWLSDFSFNETEIVVFSFLAKSQILDYGIQSDTFRAFQGFWFSISLLFEIAVDCWLLVVLRDGATKWFPPDDPTHPLYIHPSYNPCSILLVTELLNGTNYLDWSRSMQTALLAKNKLKIGWWHCCSHFARMLMIRCWKCGFDEVIVW